MAKPFIAEFHVYNEILLHLSKAFQAPSRKILGWSSDTILSALSVLKARAPALGRSTKKAKFIDWGYSDLLWKENGKHECDIIKNSWKEELFFKGKHSKKWQNSSHKRSNKSIPTVLT